MLSKLEASSAAHKTAVERAEEAETQVSMTMLDLKNTQTEARELQGKVDSLQQKVGSNWRVLGSRIRTFCNWN